MDTPATATAIARILRVIGCDVGKAKIVVFDTLTGRTREVANEPEALEGFVRELDGTCLVVCEATGGYERNLLVAAAEAGIPAHRADARKVKAFIRSLGRIAKTDAIDAQGLARYGQERHQDLALWQPPTNVLEELQTLVRLRRQLVGYRTALTNQLKAPGGQAAKPHLQDLIDTTAESIRKIETDLDTLVEQDLKIARRVEIISEIPGCGLLTAISIAALIPEIGTTTKRRIASLAGLAPHPYDSGEHHGYRRTRGGRPEIKQILFMMAAMAARNHNPELKAFYTRLVKNGKKPLVAITAVMRKLITIINARIRDAENTPEPQPN
jgi:transposase